MGINKPGYNAKRKQLELDALVDSASKKAKVV